MQFPEKTYLCMHSSVSHSAFTSLLDRWWTNSFGGDICWTQMTWADDTIRLLTVFWH